MVDKLAIYTMLKDQIIEEIFDAKRFAAKRKAAKAEVKKEVKEEKPQDDDMGLD